jgi:polyphosphate glucokinase
MKKRSSTVKKTDGAANPRTLAVDVGGTGVKAMVLDARGKAVSERVRIPTPKHATPKALIAVVRKLAKRSGEFDRVAMGFPGVLKNGVVYTAPNLGKGWNGFKLEEEVAHRLERPTRVANDADVQGLGCVSGRGVELVITLGTGVGSVLFADGKRIHLELAHHPFHEGKTYEDELGHHAMEKKGKKKWNKLLREAIDDLKNAFNYDRLYLGGGDSAFIKLKLPPSVKIVSNMEGLLGAIALWREEEPKTRVRRRRAKKAIAKVASKADSSQAPPEPTAPSAAAASRRMPSPSQPRRMAPKVAVPKVATAPSVAQLTPPGPAVG